ncbi:MAG: alpha/beta fold hydrolase [Thermoleophilaceae bacterium]|nr:alpha/beta fold hydrolase [Thermoleophilaceae bacterium]
MDLHHIRRGEGRPLVLVHGLGSDHGNWSRILDALAEQREVIAPDLPGFGDSPPLPEEPTIAALAGALEAFFTRHDLDRPDVVGSSMGARLVLELARRGKAGATVALAPGGFWTENELRFFKVTVGASIKLVRALAPVMPQITGSAVGRTALLAQFSHKPWALPAPVALHEMQSFAQASALDETFRALVGGPLQEGATDTPGPVTIGWGRQDRVLLPSQAERAQARFPNAELHFFDGCGHFPQWDQPGQTTGLILSRTG